MRFMESGTGAKNAKRRRDGVGKKVAALGIAAALVGGVVFLLWPKPLKVETALVEKAPLVVSVSEEGKTRIRHRYTVSAPVTGFLNRIPLRAGDPVRTGKTVLAVIEAEASGLLTPRSRAEAEARLRTAEAARSLRRSELDRARVNLDLAQKQFRRQDRLLPAGGISQQEWDIAETALQVAAKDAKATEFALRMAEFEVEQAKSALIQGEEGAPRAASVRLLAPVDGYVLNVFEESARTVSSGTPLMEVGDPDDLEGEVDLFSVDAAVVPPEAEVLVEGWGGAMPLRGRISLVEHSGFTKISALGVEEQRVKARITFLDPVPPGYRLGDRFRIQARIILRRSDDALQVPLGALFRQGGDWMTFVVREDKAFLQRVEIGQNDGVAAEVLSGLSEGDRVVLHPSEKVADGAAVTERGEKNP